MPFFRTLAFAFVLTSVTLLLTYPVAYFLASTSAAATSSCSCCCC